MFTKYEYAPIGMSSYAFDDRSGWTAPSLLYTTMATSCSLDFETRFVAVHSDGVQLSRLLVEEPSWSHARAIAKIRLDRLAVFVGGASGERVDESLAGDTQSVQKRYWGGLVMVIVKKGQSNMASMLAVTNY